ncbi:hypothetical protein V6Z12_D13G204900 [Gossypium hirsutum]
MIQKKVFLLLFYFVRSFGATLRMPDCGFHEMDRKTRKEEEMVTGVNINTGMNSC